MSFSEDGFKDIIKELVEGIARDGVETAEGFWADIEDSAQETARRTMRRYAENQLMAIRDPSNAEDHLASAAHNLNTLANLTAGEKIHARREARNLMNRVFDRILDAGFAAIDIAL